MDEVGKDLTERIINAELTATENKSIEMLISQIEKTAFLSGSQMAEMCGVSAASMTRLVRKLGYGKLAEFKNALEDMYRKTVSPYDMFESFISMDARDKVVQESMQNDYLNIKIMEEMLDEETMRAIAHAIGHTRKVYIAGMFASEAMVMIISHFLWRLGIDHKEVVGLGLFNKFQYSDTQKGDVLIAVSSQRIFKEVVETVELANSQEMTTIAITDNYTNSLARAADYSLIAPVKGRVFDCTHVATVMVINAMFNLIASEMREQVEKNLKEETNKCFRKDLFCV